MLRSSLSFLLQVSLVLPGIGIAQAPPLGEAYCFGDGSLGDCPCPSQVLLRENFDEGVLPVGWVAEGLWQFTDACGGTCGSSSFAYFGDEDFCTYQSVQVNDNRLISPPLILPEASKIDLDFCSNLWIEPEGHHPWVRVHGDDGTVLAFHFKYTNPLPIDLTPLAGQVVRIEFLMQVDFWGGTNESGWKIDDVLVRSTHNGFPKQGCLNSMGKGGRLEAAGSASIATDNFVFYVQKLPPSVPVLFLATDSPYLPPVPLWAGLSCMGSNPLALQSKLTKANGSAAIQPFETHAAQFQPGATYGFQAWYRDDGAMAPCGLGRNLTQGLRIVVQP